MGQECRIHGDHVDFPELFKNRGEWQVKWALAVIVNRSQAGPSRALIGYKTLQVEKRLSVTLFAQVFCP